MESEHERVCITLSDPMPSQVPVVTPVPGYALTHVRVKLFRKLLDTRLLTMAVFLRGFELSLVEPQLDLVTHTKSSTSDLGVDVVVDHVKEGLSVNDLVQVVIDQWQLTGWVQTLPVVTPCCPKYFRCGE